MKMIKSSLMRPTVRGLVLALAVTTLASFLAQAVPYASQVSQSGNTVTFILNEAAAGITILRDGANPVTPSPGPATPGPQTFDMTGYTTYSIIVTGNTAKAWTQFIPDGTDRNFYFPNSVAINKNPASPNFGKVYIGNNNLATPGNTGAGRLTTDGIFVLRADGVAVSGPHTGGQDMTIDGSNLSFPYKINLNPDDDCVYLTSYYNDLAFGFNADLSVCTQLIDASNKTNTISGTNTYLQYVESIYATGSRSTGNLVIYTVDSNYNDTNRKGLVAYTLGANLTATPGDLGQQVIGPSFYTYYPGDVDRDSSGNWYMTQYRATAGQAPDVNKFDGSQPWPINTAAWASDSHTYIRSVGVNEAGGTVAVGRYATSSGIVYFYDINTGASKGSLDIGDYSRDIAFDAAGNMVSVDNTTEYARFWSPGGFTVTTTSSDGTFTLYKPDDLTVAAADAAAAEEGPDTATFTITRTGTLAASLQVNFTLTGTATSNVDYTISPQSPFTFPASQATVDITVTPINDSEREAAETVILTLQPNANDYYVASPSSATATIVDNDLVLRYWDSNGATAGAGDPATGTWGTDNFWSTSADGTAATAAWTPWAAAVFSAGADTFTPFTVTVNGTQLVDYLDFEDFAPITLAGGALTLTNQSGIKVTDRALIASDLNGAGGLILDGPGSLVLSNANTYTGPTIVNGGSLVVGAAGGVIPDGSGVTLGATAKLNLNDQLFSGGTYDETIGGLAGVAGAEVNVPDGYTLTFGGNSTATTWSGTTIGGGLLAKVGTATTTIGSGAIGNRLAISNGVIRINSSADLDAASTADVHIDGGTLRNNGTGVGAALMPYARSIILGAAGGTIDITDAAAIYIYGNASAVGTIQGGTLIKAGAGELRINGLAMANSSFQKLVVNGGLYRGGFTSPTQSENFLGAVPGSFLADQITISNGARLGHSLNAFEISANRGIVLGVGGGRIRDSISIPGVISGTQLIKDLAGTLVLKGANTYTDGTTLSTGTLLARNTTGSATGSGSVSVTAGTLGGDGIIGGPVGMTGGTLAPGYNYTVGYAAFTRVSNSVVKLTVTNGLDIAGTATYSWQLGALSTANPGTDWDQVDLTGGTLTLGGSAVLAIGFVAPATAPDLGQPFWQTAQQWKIIANPGGGSVSGNFSSISGTNGITAGTFTTVADATGVTLVYTPNAIPPAPATMSSVSVGGGNVTINYSGGAGSQFVLLKSLNVDALLNTWTPVATNATPAGSFVIPVGSDPKAFYCIQSK